MGLENGQFDGQKYITIIESYYHKVSAEVANAVKEAIKEILKIVGDYPGLYTVIQDWITAIGPISKAQGYLQTAQADLPTAWTGPAATSYNTYLTNLQTACTNLSNCMSDGSAGIVEQLQNVGTTLTSNYKALVDLVVKCAQALQNLVSSLTGDIGKLISGVFSKDVGNIVDGATGIDSDMEKAMSEFVGAVGDWIDKVFDANDNLHKNIYQIEAKAQKLVVPAPTGY